MQRTFHHETGTPTRPSGSLQLCRLEELRLIRVAGAERAQFLQGQITQDLRRVDPGRSALYGWTTAQGRLLLTGQVFDWRAALWLTTPAAMADKLVGRLRMFVLRAQVSVDVGDAVLLGLWGGAAADALAAEVLPAVPLACAGTPGLCAMRVGGDAARVLIATDATGAAALAAALGAQPGPESAWRLADVRAGLAQIGPATENALTPQMVNLDLLGGIGFDKGCYAGQEIITRTRHLGRIKRRMLRFACAADAALEPGAPIFAIEREAGTVVVAAPAPRGQELLAVTLLDALAGPLFADRERLQPLARLDLPYPVPEAGETVPA